MGEQGVNWIASKVRGDRCLVMDDRSDVWLFRPDSELGFTGQLARRNVHLHFEGRSRPAHECDTARVQAYLDDLIESPYL